MNRRPNAPLLNVLIAVTVDAASARNLLPGDFGKPLFESGRQTARRLGNDFKAARRRVKGLVVGKECVEVETVTKRIARAMLSRMSSSASRSASESIDRVGGCTRAKAWLQGFAVDHVNGALKQAGDVILQTRIVEHRGDNGGVEVNENINVAVGSLLVTRDGTEQGGMRNAMRPQVGLALPQPLYDLVTFHAAFIPYNDRQMRLSFCNRFSQRKSPINSTIPSCFKSLDFLRYRATARKGRNRSPHGPIATLAFGLTGLATVVLVTLLSPSRVRELAFDGGDDRRRGGCGIRGRRRSAGQSVAVLELLRKDGARLGRRY